MVKCVEKVWCGVYTSNLAKNDHIYHVFIAMLCLGKLLKHAREDACMSLQWIPREQAGRCTKKRDFQSFEKVPLL